eukprot:3387038-Pyramimonas_sp.AAC.1
MPSLSHALIVTLLLYDGEGDNKGMQTWRYGLIRAYCDCGALTGLPPEGDDRVRSWAPGVQARLPGGDAARAVPRLSLIHISEPTRPEPI